MANTLTKIKTVPVLLKQKLTIVKIVNGIMEISDSIRKLFLNPPVLIKEIINADMIHTIVVMIGICSNSKSSLRIINEQTVPNPSIQKADDSINFNEYFINNPFVSPVVILGMKNPPD